ncbi:S8 family serine peptidase [Rhodocytophaga rosea]|uniref:S8 family serine peptidase n=1 Tax=Rhodocytophaga rosea TaxID=2704465 RepID=A0A6C0GQ65_9BACT|nr:S8 family serine peptidase [Rhodocytophaga rosea]QHT70215.1 S8 family serine peptidase [Rhodocytophaga rosea]
MNKVLVSIINYILLALCCSCIPVRLQAQHTKENASTFHHKIAPGLIDRAYRSEKQQFRILVKDKDQFKSWLSESLSGVSYTQLVHHRNILEFSQLLPSQIALLATCPWVMFIDVSDRKAREELSVEKADFSLNTITSVHSLFPQIHGKGITVSVKERLFDTTDIDFRGRIIPALLQNSTISTHATTMTTLIAGGGNSSFYGKGTAWQASITSSDFSNLLPDDGKQLQQRGISVQNHSYGVTIENYYGLEAYAYDQQTRQFPQILHVFSSGNEGTGTSTIGNYATIPGVANLTGQFKMSKNTLSVGGTDPSGQLEELSSRGPAYDGRIKPELVAYGDGGTSEAAAMVSGISALVQQSYLEKNGTLPPAALVKAILLNSANEAGRPGIDFETGFGQADALGAIRTVKEERFKQGAITNGDKQQFTIQVPAGIHELKITLTWHDIEAQPNAAKALVNDLEVQVFHQPSGKSWLPWVLNHFPHPDSLLQPAKRGADHLNTIEQISIVDPEAGEYTVQVEGYNITSGLQEFSLAYEWNPDFEWLYPVTHEKIQAGKTMFIRWQWKDLPVEATLSFRSTSSNEWQTISQVDLSQSFYEWMPPDSLIQGQFRLTFDTQEILSDTFTVEQIPDLAVGYNCENEVLLQWPAVKGATHYQLYQLGEKYLEPFMLVNDTLVLLTKAQTENPYFVIVPWKDTFPIGRSYIVDIRIQGPGCYIRSLLAKELVTENVLLDLALSSVYRLQTLFVERWENGAFKTIQTISPVTNLNYELADPAPGLGRNVYRIRVENVNNQTYYSQEVAVYYIRSREVLIFPNPVTHGQPLNIAVSENDAIQVTFFDLSGKRMLTISEIGEIKEISTNQLPRGTYIVHILTPSGEVLKTRVVVL